MSRQRIALVLGLVVAVGLLCWWFQSRPMPPAQEIARAAFSFPQSPSKEQTRFQIIINGTDAIQGVPNLKCGEKVPTKVSIVPSEKHLVSLLMIPRLPEQVEDGFSKSDVYSDPLTGLSHGKAIPDSDLVEYSIQIPVMVQPGEYIVRYFLFRLGKDLETTMPSNHFLGEGRIRVVEGKKPGVMPLSNPKGIFPLIQTP